MKIRWSLLALTGVYGLNYDKSHLKKEKNKKNKGLWFTPTQNHSRFLLEIDYLRNGRKRYYGKGFNLSLFK